jgi:glycosyltransferase involved in cell wall biosynthesis
LRALHIGRALKQVGEVTLAVVSSDVATEAVLQQTSGEFQMEAPVRVVPLPNRKLSQRFRRAFDTHYLNVHGVAAAREDRKQILRRRDQFDLVWVLNSRTPNILDQWHWPRAVLDIDDVPSTFQHSIVQNGVGWKAKLKAGVTMLLLRRRERLWKERFSALAVCSEADKAYLGGGERIHVIPNGFERPIQPPIRTPAQPPRIGFIGLYSYLPNLAGVRWFVRECWPKIKLECPGARLRLAGKDTDGALKPAGADIDGLGWVADPEAEIATWSAMIIPLQYGAGTRIKIADAFSRKCPVVSTRLGAFGYAVQHGRELILADQPHDFASGCISLIRDPQTAMVMAERAFDAFLENWTWDAIAPKVWAAAEGCLRQDSAKVLAG